MIRINANPNNWGKDVYIASKVGTQLDIEGNEINVYDILNADIVVVDTAAMKYIEEVLK